MTIISIGTTVAVVAVLLGGPKPHAVLELSYAAESGPAAEVSLTCGPDDGGHPEPVAACTLLRRAGAHSGKIKPEHTLCPMIYAPVTARLTGVWRGRKLDWSRVYGNRCELSRATGVLFKF